MKSLCIIFDLDGTLVDSERLCNQAFIDLLSFITDSIDSLVDQYRGKKLSVILTDIEQRSDKSLPADFETIYRCRVDELFQSHLQPVAGVPKMLETLDYPCCIASSGPMAKIQQALAVTGLAHHFGDRLFSSYDVGSWKPDPGLFLHAAQAMGFPAEQCVVIEDSDVGIEAAQAAGMLALRYLHVEKAEEKKYVFSKMRLLPKWLDAIDIKLTEAAHRCSR